MHTQTHRLERTGEDERLSLTPPPSPAPQTAVLTTQLKGVGVVRTTDVQVSERTPLNELRIKPYGPIYNQLTGEVLTHCAS